MTIRIILNYDSFCGAVYKVDGPNFSKSGILLYKCLINYLYEEKDTRIELANFNVLTPKLDTTKENVFHKKYHCAIHRKINKQVTLGITRIIWFLDRNTF